MRSLSEQASERLVMIVLRAQLPATVHQPCRLLDLLQSRSHMHVPEYDIPACVPSVLSNLKMRSPKSSPILQRYRLLLICQLMGVKFHSGRRYNFLRQRCEFPRLFGQSFELLARMPAGCDCA